MAERPFNTLAPPISPTPVVRPEDIAAEGWDETFKAQREASQADEDTYEGDEDGLKKSEGRRRPRRSKRPSVCRLAPPRQTKRSAQTLRQHRALGTSAGKPPPKLMNAPLQDVLRGQVAPNSTETNESILPPAASAA